MTSNTKLLPFLTLSAFGLLAACKKEPAPQGAPVDSITRTDSTPSPRGATLDSVRLRHIADSLDQAWSSSEPIDDQESSCMTDNGSTMGMLECTNKAEASWDKELNVYYQRIQPLLNAQQQSQLKEVQRAWIAFQKGNSADIAAVPTCYEGYGTIVQNQIADMSKATVRFRAQELRSLYFLLREHVFLPGNALGALESRSASDQERVQKLRNATPDKLPALLNAAIRAEEASMKTSQERLAAAIPTANAQSVTRTQRLWEDFARRNRELVGTLTPDENAALALDLATVRHRALELASLDVNAATKPEAE